MLFYERKGVYKSREPDDEQIEQVDLSVKEAEDLEHYKQVRIQNQKYWRSRHIFGNEYSRFVMGLSKLLSPPDKFLIQFLLTIQIRTKDKRQELVAVCERINKALGEKIELSEWLLEMLSVEQNVKEFLLHNPMHLMRRLIVGLVKIALKAVDSQVRTKFFIWQIRHLSEANKRTSKHFAQYLEVVKESCLRNPDVIDQYNAIDLLIGHLMRENHQVPDAPAFENTDIYLGYDKCEQTEDSIKDDSFFADSKGSSYAHLYHTLFIFRNKLSPERFGYLKQPSIIVSILREVDSKLSARSLGRLYAEVCHDDVATTNVYMKALKESYQMAEYYMKSKYLRCFTPFLIHEDQLQEPKIKNFLQYMFKVMRTCKYQSEVEQSINYIYKISSKFPVILKCLTQETEDLIWLEKWITHNMKVSYSSFKNTATQQAEEYIRPTYQILLNKLKKLNEGEAPNSSEEWDSDEDLGTHKFKEGEEVDLLDQTGQSWVRAKVEANIGELVWLSVKQSTSSDQWTWKDIQSEELAPAGTKTAHKSNNSY